MLHKIIYIIYFKTNHKKIIADKILHIKNVKEKYLL